MSAARTFAERDAVSRSSTDQREHERKVVAEHYEHDPEIFELVLDSRLAYATGVFAGDDDDLKSAQARKFQKLAAKLDLRPGERMFDAGCGWGSNLLYLAEHTQAQFHGVTLSERQAEILMKRARKKGVADRVEIEVRHIEDLDLPDASYDAVLFSGSIVHMHNREAVHQMAARILKPGGRVLISDCYYPATDRGDRFSTATDYIFVSALGYCRLLTLSEEMAFMEAANLDIIHVEDLTDSYAKTLACWIDNVRKNRRLIDERSPGFARLLQKYMAVARASFAQRTALEYIILATKGHPRANVGAWPIPGDA